MRRHKGLTLSLILSGAILLTGCTGAPGSTPPPQANWQSQIQRHIVQEVSDPRSADIAYTLTLRYSGSGARPAQPPVVKLGDQDVPITKGGGEYTYQIEVHHEGKTAQDVLQDPALNTFTVEWNAGDKILTEAVQAFP